MINTNDHRVVEVLLVSGNVPFRDQLHGRLSSMHWHILEAESGADALDQLYLQPMIEVILLDPVLPDLLPAEFCGIVRQRFPLVAIMTMNTHTGKVEGGTTPGLLSAQLDELIVQIPSATTFKSVAAPIAFPHKVSTAHSLPGMIGNSPQMQQTYAMVHKVAARATTVMITGESGTGKDLVAQAIHALSPRRDFPFVVVNCAAIPEALLEAELFGYAKGAFTGAVQSRMGRIHAAQGGTLFLDEIGDMPLALQSKILRFLEQGEVQRLGSNDNLKVDVRVIAATNAGLPELVKQKLFREDLYYRLAIFPIRLAPLRERQADIAALAEFFAARFFPGSRLCPNAIAALHCHRWPGNVRELRNVMERAAIVATHAQEITAQDILL